MSRGSRLRVAVWSTGGVGSRAIDAINRRPDLELVGVWVHTPEKVGRDVGGIIGCEPLGIFATNSAQEIIDLAPHCVVYAASGPERGAGAVPDYEHLLSHGINVVTTTSTALVFPPRATQRCVICLLERQLEAVRRCMRQASSLDLHRTNSRSCSRPCRAPSAVSAWWRYRSTITIRSPR